MFCTFSCYCINMSYIRYLAGLLAFAGLAAVGGGVQICPRGSGGEELTCSVHCCASVRGNDREYFCCGIPDDNAVVVRRPADASSQDEQQIRAERFATTYQTSALQVDYSLLVIGLIISVILSIVLSLLCCLLCNGCWLHRRRNPHMYETVNDSGFYPICCGFGIPLGTVVFSTHPPQFQNDGVYGGSTASYASSRNRVRFNEDGTLKGVLKNGQDAGGQYPPPAGVH